MQEIIWNYDCEVFFIVEGSKKKNFARMLEFCPNGVKFYYANCEIEVNLAEITRVVMAKPTLFKKGHFLFFDNNGPKKVNKNQGPDLFLLVEFRKNQVEVAEIIAEILNDNGIKVTRI